MNEIPEHILKRAQRRREDLAIDTEFSDPGTSGRITVGGQPFRQRMPTFATETGESPARGRHRSALANGIQSRMAQKPLGSQAWSAQSNKALDRAEGALQALEREGFEIVHRTLAIKTQADAEIRATRIAELEEEVSRLGDQEQYLEGRLAAKTEVIQALQRAGEELQDQVGRLEGERKQLNAWLSTRRLYDAWRQGV